MSAIAGVDSASLKRALRVVSAVVTSAVSRSVPALSHAAARQIGESAALDLIVSGHLTTAAVGKAATTNTGLAVDVDGVQLVLDPDGSLRIDGQPAVAMPEAEWEADQRELDQLRRAAAAGPVPTPAVPVGTDPDDVALRAVADEVVRRRVEDGDLPEHDDAHANGELAQAAATLAFPPQRRAVNGAGSPYTWPFHHSTWRPPVDREKQLVEAGALVVAELARFGRARRRREGTS